MAEVDPDVLQRVDHLPGLAVAAADRVRGHAAVVGACGGIMVSASAMCAMIITTPSGWPARDVVPPKASLPGTCSRANGGAFSPRAQGLRHRAWG